MSDSPPSAEHSAGRLDGGGHRASAEWAKDQSTEAKEVRRKEGLLCFQLREQRLLYDTQIGGQETDYLGRNDS